MKNFVKSLLSFSYVEEKEIDKKIAKFQKMNKCSCHLWISMHSLSIEIDLKCRHLITDN